MKDKAIIFGVGNQYKRYRNLLHVRFEIIAYIDNFAKEIDGINIISISEASHLDFDKIIITPFCWHEMLKQCLDNGIGKDQIMILDLLPEIYQKNVCGVRSFGQHYEDLIIMGIFGQIGIEKPTYLDLGCNHPFRCSNTALMYLGGAKGVNIDANKVSAEAFQLTRTKNTLNLNCGVAPDSGVLSFYMQNEDSGLNTFSYDQVKHAQKKYNAEFNRIESVECKSLQDIIEDHCEGVFPDFFDCDIEGLDYDVIKSYDMTSKGPKVVCVEVRSDKMQQFDNLMFSYEYFKFCRMGVNNIYVRNEYKELLTCCN